MAGIQFFTVEDLHPGFSARLTLHMDTETALDLSGITMFSGNGFTEAGDGITVNGDGDAEMITVSAFADTINAGGGDDTIIVTPGGSTLGDFYSGGSGTVTLDLSAMMGDYTLNADSEVVNGFRIEDA